MEIVLQRGNGARKLLEAVEGDRADFGVLERDGFAAVPVGADAVQAEEVAEHVIAGDLLAPVLGEDGGLAGAEPDRIQGGEGLARADRACRLS